MTGRAGLYTCKAERDEDEGSARAELLVSTVYEQIKDIIKPILFRDYYHPILVLSSIVVRKME